MDFFFFATLATLVGLVAPLRRLTSACETSPAATSALTHPEESFLPFLLKQRRSSWLPTAL